MNMRWSTWRLNRIRAAALAGLAIMTVVEGCSPPPPPPPPVVEEIPARPVFTQRQFDAILYDMTYGQVSEILGAESTRQESTYDEGESEYVQPSLTAWYYWENEDGSFIKTGFVDKKLIEKSAENLPR
jgi:hypothetical protein